MRWHGGIDRGVLIFGPLVGVNATTMYTHHDNLGPYCGMWGFVKGFRYALLMPLILIIIWLLVWMCEVSPIYSYRPEFSRCEPLKVEYLVPYATSAIDSSSPSSQ